MSSSKSPTSPRSVKSPRPGLYSKGSVNSSSSLARSTANLFPGMSAAVKPNLVEDNFKKENFESTEFIERITRKIIFLQQEDRKKATNNSKNAVIFDCEPFMGTFAYTLDSLRKMAEKVDSRIENLVEETIEANEKHKDKLKDLEEHFESNFKHFQDLDTRISKVGSAAVTIGDRLQTDDTQRERALEGKEVIEYLLELNKETDEPEEPGELLERFLEFVPESDNYRERKNAPKKHTSGNASILKLNEPVITLTFETPEAERLYEKAVIAKKLISVGMELDVDKFQRAQGTIGIVSNQLEKKILSDFQDAALHYDYIKMKECASILMDFNGGTGCIIQYIQKHITPDPEILTMDKQLATSIKEDSVLDEANIEKEDTRVKKFFESMTRTCKEEYRIICRVFNNPSAVMAQLIQQLFQNRIQSFLDAILENDVNLRLWLYMKTLSTAYTRANELVAGFAEFKIPPEQLNPETLIDSVFSAFRDRYVDNEIESLTAIFTEELEEAEELRKEQEKAQKSGQVMSTTLLSLEMALNFMHASEEAVKRCLILSHKDKVPQNLGRIFNVLVVYLIKKYVNVSLEKAVQILPVACIKNYAKTVAVIENFFEMIYFVNQIVIFIQKHFHVDIFPHMQQSANDLSNCETKKNNALSALEDKIEEGVMKSLSALISALGIILSSQKATDYRLKDDASAVTETNVTKTCSDAIAFIKSVKATFEKNLDGKNIDAILEEFGNRVYDTLLTHLKQFRVSQGLGGFRILQDLSAYRECARIFNSEEVLEKFDVLKELSKVHNIDPENLHILFTDTLLSKLDKNDVIAFIKLRADFKSSWLNKIV